RTDGQLHLGVQPLHGLGQDVGAGVPVGVAVLRVFKGILIVFFGHFDCLLSCVVGAKQNSATPLMVQGGRAVCDDAADWTRGRVAFPATRLTNRIAAQFLVCKARSSPSSPACLSSRFYAPRFHPNYSGFAVTLCAL